MLHSLFQVGARSPHVNDKRQHHQDRGKSEHGFTQSFIREEARDCRAEPLLHQLRISGLHSEEQVTERRADGEPHPNGRVNSRRELRTTRLLQIRENDCDQQERLEALHEER